MTTYAVGALIMILNKPDWVIMMAFTVVLDIVIAGLIVYGDKK